MTHIDEAVTHVALRELAAETDSGPPPCYCRDNAAKVTAELVTIVDGVEVTTIEVSYHQVEGWVPDAYSFNPDALGCPKHRPIKEYCRIHHAGFYGDCPQCQSRALIEFAQASSLIVEAVEIESEKEHQRAELAAQKEVIDSAIEDLS